MHILIIILIKDFIQLNLYLANKCYYNLAPPTNMQSLFRKKVFIDIISEIKLLVCFLNIIMDFLKKLILVKLATFDILLLACYICIVLVTRPHQLQGML